jgi:hypothetical protein
MRFGQFITMEMIDSGALGRAVRFLDSDFSLLIG